MAPINSIKRITLILLYLAASIILGPDSFANYSWKQKASLPAAARHESAAFNIGTKGYFATGYDGAGTHKDLWEWDQSSNVWTQKADLPGIERYGSFAFAISGKGYLGTGWTVTNAQLRDVYEYDPVSNAWTQKANFGGVARYDAVGLSNGIKGYVGFGYIPNTNDWWEYDPTTDTWLARTNFPGAARQSLTGFCIGTDVFIGTGATSGGALFNDLWKFTPATNSWAQMANLPGVTRFATIGFTINGEGYMGSGGNGQGAYYNDFYKYDAGANSWTAIAPWPATARYAGDGFSIGNCGYAGLGRGASNIYYNDFWEYSPDTLFLTPSQTNVDCFNESTGIAGVSVTGGVQPYTYLWNPTGLTTATISNVSAGTYTVVVTDANGTTNSETITITEPASAVDVNVTGNLSFCTGSSTTLTAVATGGTGSTYDYLWNTGETTQSVSVNTAGPFSVTATDDNGCSNFFQGSVSENTPPTCSISGSTIVCSSGSTQLCAPSGMDSYVWSTGETTECIQAVAGPYSVTITDLSGCNSTCSVTVTSGNGPSCNISGNTTVCTGGTTQLCATSGMAEYLWSTGETTECIQAGDGAYSVSITDQSGCSNTCSTTVSIGSGPVCNISGNTTVCAGGTTQLCAPAGMASYLWSTGATTQCITAGDGAYSVTIEDQSGCSSTCSTTVIIGNGPVCNISGNTTVCTGGTTQLCAPSGMASYSWSTGATTQCITAGDGTYSVTIEDQSGCSSTCSTTVIIGNGPVCNISGNTTVCAGGTTQLCAPAGMASYSWSTGATTQCISAGEGNYSVTIEDQSGCSGSCDVDVTVTGNCCTGFRTQTMGGWGAVCKGNNPGCYMTSHFAAAFPSPDYLTVGCPTGFTLQLTSAQAVTVFLPSSGQPRALTSSIMNPGSYYNTLAGQLVAATLSVQFDLTDPSFSAASVNLQDLVYTSGTFAGWTVAQVLAEANNVLGGCASAYTAAQLTAALNSFNTNYDNGTIDLGYLQCTTTNTVAQSRSVEHIDKINSGISTFVYPNPFATTATIQFSSTTGGKAIVEVFSVAGYKVAELFSEQLEANEMKQVTLLSSDLPVGVYIYRVSINDEVLNGRLILMKD